MPMLNSYTVFININKRKKLSLLYPTVSVQYHEAVFKNSARQGPGQPYLAKPTLNRKFIDGLWRSLPT